MIIFKPDHLVLFVIVIIVVTSKSKVVHCERECEINQKQNLPEFVSSRVIIDQSVQLIMTDISPLTLLCRFVYLMNKYVRNVCPPEDTF